MNKHAIAGILNEIGVLLELKDENLFKVRAYHAGARALETLEEDLDTVIAEGRLQGIKGIVRHWRRRSPNCRRPAGWNFSKI